jgi:hypothetical protein
MEGKGGNGNGTIINNAFSKPRDPANEPQVEMPIGLALLNVQESMHLGEKKRLN